MGSADTACPVAVPGSAPHPEAAVVRAVILCVDDEPNILAALARLFRKPGYRVLSAASGAAALEMLRAGPVDLVISDMRMPEMDGAQFLGAVRSAWPDTVRLLLTGHADVGSIMSAINHGEIHRYLTKPWDDLDIVLTVRHALERQALERERQRLEAVTRAQNDALKSLNASLEERVQQRTADLKKAHDGLLQFNASLKANLVVSIRVFSSLIEMRGRNLAGHSSRVAHLARKIALAMGLGEAQTHDVFVAALLHNIGKVTLSDDLLKLSLAAMTAEQLRLYREHPLRGEQLLMPLDALRNAAKLIRSYQERFDGTGYPDRTSGMAIPLGARIVALASDFDNLQIGMIMTRRLRPDEALAAIRHGRGRQYDPTVVDAFMRMQDQRVPAPARRTVTIGTSALVPGTTLAADLATPDGFLLLSTDHVVDARMIRQIVRYESTLDGPLALQVFEAG